MRGEVVRAIAAVVAAFVSCWGIMGWLLGTWKADVAERESRASSTESLVMVFSLRLRRFERASTSNI